MNRPIEFLAVLVFDGGDGWVTLHPQTFMASHPEIAYQLALRKGRTPRGSKRFVGLSELGVLREDRPQLGRMERGDPADFIQEKAGLGAFEDERWRGIPCDPQELESALREPSVVFEPKDLEMVDWEQLSQAYGSAQNVPVHLRNLGSEDAGVREEALHALLMSILHQGSVYSATVAAVPFLLRLVSVSSYPDRLELMHFVREIVRECSFPAYRQRSGRSLFGEDRPSHENGDGLDLQEAMFDVLKADRDLLLSLQVDSDPSIRDIAIFLVEELGGEDLPS